MSSTEDWLDEILKPVFAYGIDWQEFKDESENDHAVSTFAGKIKDEHRSEAKAKIRQHMLSEALVLIGEDDNEVRGTTQSPDNPNYWTKRTKHRNELKAELRQAFTEKYGERE